MYVYQRSRGTRPRRHQTRHRDQVSSCAQPSNGSTRHGMAWHGALIAPIEPSLSTKTLLPDKTSSHLTPSFFLGFPMGSSGCLGGKLVVAQDVAQSLADLCVQCLCVLQQGVLRGQNVVSR